MSGYTRLSCLLWEWEPWNQLEPITRLVWLALYTSPQAKRMVPALWHGSVPSMAEAARFPLDETASALDALIERELAEYDPRHRVLRLTSLPDPGEWPSNPEILKSWFKRFQMIPACGVRDAHVQTLRWMLERGALGSEKNIGGKPTHKHEEVWGRTFGTIPIPSPRKRGIRKLSDNNDTSTSVQPSLFHAQSERRSVDSSFSGSSTPNPNKITVRETLCRGSGEGEGEGEGVGEGEESEREGEVGGPLSTPQPTPDQVDALASAVAVGVGVLAWGEISQVTRGMLLEQLLALPGLDLTMITGWLQAQPGRRQIGYDLLNRPGRLTWASVECERWDESRREHTQRAEERSAEWHEVMKQSGFAPGGA